MRDLKSCANQGEPHEPVKALRIGGSRLYRLLLCRAGFRLLSGGDDRMSTSPVMSITDEIVAELEALANGATTGPWMTETESGHLNVASEDWYLLQCHHDQPNYEEDAEYIASANPSTILALLAERKELVRDRERLDSLDKLCEAYGFEVHEGNRWVIDGPFRSVRDAIDSLPDDAAIDAARGEA